MQLSSPAAPHTCSSGWALCAVVYLMWWCSVKNSVFLEVFSNLNGDSLGKTRHCHCVGSSGRKGSDVALCQWWFSAGTGQGPNPSPNSIPGPFPPPQG